MVSFSSAVQAPTLISDNRRHREPAHPTSTRGNEMKRARIFGRRCRIALPVIEISTATQSGITSAPLNDRIVTADYGLGRPWPRRSLPRMGQTRTASSAKQRPLSTGTPPSSKVGASSFRRLSCCLATYAMSD